jgi:hypothetical protein
MRVKSLHKDNYYDKQMRAVGDEYEMDDREEGNARILQTLGKLEILEYPKPNVGKARTYQTADIQPESEPEPEGEADASEPMTTDNTDALVPGKRTYRRRDMKAEGEK